MKVHVGPSLVGARSLWLCLFAEPDNQLSCFSVWKSDHTALAFIRSDFLGFLFSFKRNRKIKTAFSALGSGKSRFSLKKKIKPKNEVFLVPFYNEKQRSVSFSVYQCGNE